MEIWKDIIEYEKEYQISNLGRVKSFKRKNLIIILKNQKNKLNYKFVYLCKKGKGKKHFFIHRLVAQAFIENPHNYPIVNHKDSNPFNNELYNLEWCTYQYNSQYSFDYNKREGSAKGKFRKDNPSAKKILQYDLNMNFIKEWDCILDAANFYKTVPGNLTAALTGRKKTAKGFIWKYKN